MAAEEIPLKNDLFLRAARGEKVERTPVWIMRQAGRYLPEFRKLREKHDFFTICRTPALAAEVTLQPIKRYNFDASIIFSDIMVIPTVMGIDVKMVKGIGPKIENPLKPEEVATRVRTQEETNVTVTLKYVADAIIETNKRLEGRVPLIGFAGAPWTLMAYMVEGSGKVTKGWTIARSWLYKHPQESHALMDKIAKVTAEYLIMQARAGAKALQLFDSWAGCLGPEQFKEFLLPYHVQIANTIREELGNDIPLILFAKGAHYALEWLNETPFDVIGIDWTISPEEARRRIPDKVLQGNLDPCALYAPKEEIVKMARKMLNGFGTQKLIANLGHGMHPHHEPEHLETYINAVHSISEEMTKKN